MASAMRETIHRQPADLRALLADEPAAAEQAERLRGRGIVAVGTGTSWHAASHAVWPLREAGVEARAVQAMDAACYEPLIRAYPDVALILAHLRLGAMPLAKRYDNHAGRMRVQVPEQTPPTG